MAELPHGFTLRGRYKILSLLGKGSFSFVYLADDAEWKGNLVAIKEIRTEQFSQEEYVSLNAHFLQEAALLSTLEHPGLPRVIDFFGERSNYYLVLEWIAGHTLEQIVSHQGVADEKEVVNWGGKICEILEYLHSRKPYPVLLGDLKPSNVVVRYDGTIKLIDFGVARYILPDQSKGISLVSPGFSPPEQYQRYHVDERGDIYSLGATLYWCLTKAPLHRYSFKIPPLRELRPQVTPALDEIISCCLKVDPRLRFGSVAALRRELNTLYEQLVKDEGEFSTKDILSALYQHKRKRS